jgi:hypothetical protein
MHYFSVTVESGVVPGDALLLDAGRKQSCARRKVMHHCGMTEGREWCNSWKGAQSKYCTTQRKERTTQHVHI